MESRLRGEKKNPLQPFQISILHFQGTAAASLRVTSERMSEIPRWCSDFDLRSGFMLHYCGGAGRTDVCSFFSVFKNILYIWEKKKGISPE